MKWSNLKINKCPKCGKDFMKGLSQAGTLLGHSCGFLIREAKYKQIVSSQINSDIDKQLEKELEDEMHQKGGEQ